MGAVDLVLQVESPKSVTAGLQRIGRAGHNVGDTSKGRIFPKFRADLLECAVVAQRMREGKIETTVVPRNPLDVLAQQIVAMAASARTSRCSVDDAARAASPRTYTYAELSRAQLENVLDMLDGRYPSRGVRRAAPADRVGPRGRDDPRAQGRPRAGDHQRRHDPRPRPVLRQPARTAAASASSTRRWSTRRAPGQVFLLGASSLADRGDHARPRDRHAGAGRAGRGAVLEGRRRRAPARARRGDRRVRALGGRPGRRRRSSATTTSTRARPRNLARVPARAAGGDARRPERPHDRRSSASATRSATGALCVLSPVRRPRARRLGARAERAHPRASTASSPTRSGPTTGSSSTSPTPTSRPAPSSC